MRLTSNKLFIWWANSMEILSIGRIEKAFEHVSKGDLNKFADKCQHIQIRKRFHWFLYVFFSSVCLFYFFSYFISLLFIFVANYVRTLSNFHTKNFIVWGISSQRRRHKILTWSFLPFQKIYCLWCLKNKNKNKKTFRKKNPTKSKVKDEKTHHQQLNNNKL